MSEPNEAELIAALNAELEAQGYSYRVEHGVYRGAETDVAIVRAIEALVKETGKPARPMDTANKSGLPISTVKTAMHRLLSSGQVIGAGPVGYMVRKNA